MASGTPVIASNLPGVRSVFRKDVHGSLVHPGDVEDLAKKLEWYLANPDKAAERGRAGRSWVEEHYSWVRVARTLDTVYSRVAYAPELSEHIITDAS